MDLWVSKGLWHSRCIRPSRQRNSIEEMNLMPNAESVLEVGKANFETEVLGSKYPVVVVFWAPWTGGMPRVRVGAERG